MELDEEELSAQPLAKLLQNANSLTRDMEAGVVRSLKLRPEVLDIQRTKDVGGSQPVSFHTGYCLFLSFFHFFVH